METWDFFIHTGKGSPMIGLKMNFNTKVKVTNIYRKFQNAPIGFNPHGTVSKSISLNFGLGVISEVEHDIGVTIETKQNAKPRIEEIIWIKNDGKNTKAPMTSKEVRRINHNYLEQF